MANIVVHVNTGTADARGNSLERYVWTFGLWADYSALDPWLVLDRVALQQRPSARHSWGAVAVWVRLNHERRELERAGLLMAKPPEVTQVVAARALAELAAKVQVVDGTGKVLE